MNDSRSRPLALLADRVQGPRGWLPPSMANEEDDPVIQEVTAVPHPLPGRGPFHPSSGQPGTCWHPLFLIPAWPTPHFFQVSDPASPCQRGFPDPPVSRDVLLHTLPSPLPWPYLAFGHNTSQPLHISFLPLKRKPHEGRDFVLFTAVSAKPSPVPGN